ncbi:type I-E CRISPR-associated protein Cse1/CasA [Bifidobacterium aerophilum]|uniref:Type I-E CRISPR-associated protein Cse1/CasA n=2 Tax=Bifidobacterium aerophilum TaxID=1798155 RepID=A0A6N9Z5P5_9BIFI|nr:type I-E CRISPR-associated protein Cse1/CasA [Bifidobacterium aerophilum]
MSNNRVSFNLMDRSWIPVTMLNDGRHRELSIIETFEQASAIRSIDGDIPLQRFAIVRMLVAILYGRFGNDITAEEWKEDLYDHGADDPGIMQAIRDYCETWRWRFDLFDDKVPFYQVAGLHTAKHEVSGLERLILDVPSGEPLFTTRLGEGLRSISAAEAARWLIAMQAYDASGIKSGAVGDPRVKGGKGYPIGVAWAGHLGGYLIEGVNLWQTLILNYAGCEALGLGASDARWAEDAPVWEREPLGSPPARGFDQPAERTADTSFFHGPATLMTWQSRRMLLAHEDETVTGVLVCNGDRLKPQNGQDYETMTGWRRSPTQEKALKRSLVYMPRKHDPARALWRGLPLLTCGEDTNNANTDNALRPYTMTWLSHVRSSMRWNETVPVRLHAFGVEYGNNDAVIDTAIDDVLDLNLIVITSRNPNMGQMLRQAVDNTDQGVSALRMLAANIASAAGLPSESAQRRASELGYATFDRAFRQWVRGIDHDDDLYELQAQWNRTAKTILLRLSAQITAQASPRAIVGRDMTDANGTVRHYSVALAEIWFRGKLNSIFPKDASIPEPAVAEPSQDKETEQ